jgi:hypothetical protein
MNRLAASLWKDFFLKRTRRACLAVQRPFRCWYHSLAMLSNESSALAFFCRFYSRLVSTGSIPFLISLRASACFFWLLLNSLAGRRPEPTAFFVCCHTVFQALVSSVVRLYEQEKALAGKQLQRPIERFSFRRYSSVGQSHLMVSPSRMLAPQARKWQQNVMGHGQAGFGARLTMPRCGS